MWSPLTPTLPRKSSLKKIIISSPSQELLHFLTLPNPAAAQDPRSRIHILTPKSKHRSLSRTNLPHPAKSPLLTTPKAPLPSRDCFIRKRGNQAGWKKMDLKFRSEKLQIRNSDERIVSSLCSSQSSDSAEENKRLDMTFGAEGFWNCIKV
jgi:hypothetical protein